MSVSPLGTVGDRLSGTITIRTNVKGIGELSIPVTGTVVAAVRAYPSIVNCGSVLEEQGIRQSVTVASLLAEAFQIEGVDSPDEAVKCDYSSAIGEEQRDITIEGLRRRSQNCANAA